MTTPTRPPRESERLPESIAKSLLARASELDANSAAVSELRAAALEAGISNAAFEAALAEYRQGAQVARPAQPVAEPRPRRRGLVAAAVAFLAVLGFFVMMRAVPSQVQVVDPFQTRITLNCLSPQAASELARTVLDLRTSTIATAPGALTISAPTQEQLDRVRDLIAQRERSVCSVPTNVPNLPPSR